MPTIPPDLPERARPLDPTLPWAARVEALRERLDTATAELDPPFAVVDLAAFDANAAALVTRAATRPIRVASKSVRARDLLRRVLARPGWRGVMAYTVAEAIWLVRDGITDDVLVAYPSADRAALRELAGDPALAAAITLMVDTVEQLDFLDATVVPAGREPLRLCIDLDASWRPVGSRMHVGVRRSPVHSPAQAGALAAAITARAGFRLVGLMCYEAQVAGLGNRPAGHTLRGLGIRAMQARSMPEIVARRGAAVAAVRRHADLEFVNGGGTGSVEATAADPSVTEVAAGSGLYGPALFDAYRSFRPQPAALFALPVVRRPSAGIVTVLGGGWVASGEPGPSRLPVPTLPGGLRLLPREGTGEVQTPLRGPATAQLAIGDRVWFRHAKAGELAEHVEVLHLVEGAAVTGAVPTYRGERRAFL